MKRLVNTIAIAIAAVMSFTVAAEASNSSCSRAREKLQQKEYKRDNKISLIQVKHEAKLSALHAKKQTLVYKRNEIYAQVENLRNDISKLQEKLTNPNLTQEQIDEIQQRIADKQQKIENKNAKIASIEEQGDALAQKEEELVRIRDDKVREILIKTQPLIDVLRSKVNYYCKNDGAQY